MHKGKRDLGRWKKKKGKRLTEFRIIRKVTRTFIYAAAATRYIADDKFRVSCISPNVKKQKSKTRNGSRDFFFFLLSGFSFRSFFAVNKCFARLVTLTREPGEVTMT